MTWSSGKELPQQWDSRLGNDNRAYYLDHSTQTTYWIPPIDNWNCLYGLPFGWELAVDTAGKLYYVNHYNQQTTYSDPRDGDLLEESDEIVEARTLLIHRHPQLGFGFVAGSEKPVVVRYVTEGGPSVSKLLPGDEIRSVNGEDVTNATKDHVVSLVRGATDSVELTVCQPQNDSNTKSSLLSSSKRARLKHQPSRVRFAEGVVIGTPPLTPSGTESYVPLMPNVLRVFLENGQTRSFKYDHTTTVQDVLENLREKLSIEKIEHFALLLEHPQGHRSHKMTLLRPDERLSNVASRPGSQHFRCLFRLTFICTDPVHLLTLDPVSFHYYYQQCVCDVVSGRFAYEMRYEACLRLAALHMQQIAFDTHMVNCGSKISMKAIEKEYGLSTFLPMILLENVKRKEIRKHLRYYLKRDRKRQETTNYHGNPTGDPSMAIKIKYVHMLSHMPTFGGRTFLVTLKESNTEMILQVHPSSGIMLTSSNRLIEQDSLQPSLNYAFEAVASLSVVPYNDVLKQLNIQLRPDISQVQWLEILVDKDDIDDAVLYIQGYNAIHTASGLKCSWKDDPQINAVPPYLGLHSVRPAGWNYPTIDDLDGDNKKHESTEVNSEHLVDLSRGPPPYLPPENEPILSALVQADIHHTQVSIEVDHLEKEEDEGGDQFPAQNNTMDVQLNQEEAVTRKDSDNIPPMKSFLKAKDSILIRNKHKSGHKESSPKKSTTSEVKSEASSSHLGEITNTDQTGDLSSSESESLSTPSESPIHRPVKSRPSRLVANLPFQPGKQQTTSFGLRSPDTLPCSVLSDSELQNLIATCGLQGQQLEDLLLLFPDNFCTDPDIIDLTNFNPPQAIAGCCGSPLQPPTPFRDDDPREQFTNVIMERLAEGDVSVIEDSHQNATKISGDVDRPPPPKVHLDASRRLLQDTPYCDSRNSLVRNRSSSGGLERLLARKLIAARANQDTKLAPLHNPVIAVTSRNNNFVMSTSHTFPSQKPISLDDSGIYLGTMSQSERTRNISPFRESDRKIIQLDNFNGLESSEFSSDITSVDLKHFDGLERLSQGISSIELSKHKIVNSATDSDGSNLEMDRGRSGSHSAQVRVRSVDPHCSKSPEDSPRRRVGSLKFKLSDLANKAGSVRQKTAALKIKKAKSPTPIKDTADTDSIDSRKVDLASFTGLESAGTEENKESEAKTTTVNLSNWTGLENSGREPEIPHKVDLANYNGLQGCDASSSVWSGGSNYHESSSAHSTPRRGPLRQYRKSTSDSFTPFLSFVHSDPLSEASDLAGTYGNTAKIMGNGTVPDSSTGAPTTADFETATVLIKKLVTELSDTIKHFPMKSPKRSLVSIAKSKADQGKANVLSEAQQFAYSAKMLVRACTQQPGCAGQLLPSLNRATAKAQSMQRACKTLISDGVEVLFKAQLLGARVNGVLVAFEGMLMAVEVAQGKQLAHPNMKKLMLQSTTLAATLTQLIRAVRDA